MKEVIEISALLVGGLYALLLLSVYCGFATRRSVANGRTTEKTIAIVIAVRNEAATIIDLLRGLDQQSYDQRFHVFVVNDSSTDDTVEKASAYEPANYTISILQSNGTGKKAALATGILAARAEIILVTDGDSVPQRNWINSYAEHFEDASAFFVAGMVQARNGSSVLRQALTTELIFLQVASAGLYELGRTSMCNGANMGFTKSFFVDTGGFSNDDFASGDDIALLRKAVARGKSGVRWNYAADSMVTTVMESKWSAAVKQRQRWLSKVKSYNEAGLLLTAPLFLAVQLLLPCALIACFIYGSVMNPIVGALGIKIGVELLLLSLAAPFFGEKKTIPFFPVSVFVYCTISLAAVMRLPGGKVQWKDRIWRNGRMR